MSDATPSAARCAVCAKSLEPGERIVSVPDLLIEIHEACQRQTRPRPDADPSASR